MTPEERQQMLILCERIANEKNHQIFMDLVRQLNDLMEGKRRRFQEKEKSEQ